MTQSGSRSGEDTPAADAPGVAPVARVRFADQAIAADRAQAAACMPSARHIEVRRPRGNTEIWAVQDGHMSQDEKVRLFTCAREVYDGIGAHGENMEMYAPDGAAVTSAVTLERDVPAWYQGDRSELLRRAVQEVQNRGGEPPLIALRTVEEEEEQLTVLGASVPEPDMANRVRFLAALDTALFGAPPTTSEGCPSYIDLPFCPIPVPFLEQEWGESLAVYDGEESEGSVSVRETPPSGSFTARKLSIRHERGNPPFVPRDCDSVTPKEQEPYLEERRQIRGHDAIVCTTEDILDESFLQARAWWVEDGLSIQVTVQDKEADIDKVWPLADSWPSR
ncbi:MAG TPA: hypothetical protein PKB03_00465 [Baekduia sp.]|nr:hypothetical protein [Baekduia sp.]